MSPSLPILDLANCRLPNAIFRGELALRENTTRSPYLSDLNFSQFCMSEGFAARPSAVAVCILAVLLWGSVIEIAEGIVLPIAILVANVHAFRALAQECSSNECVNRRVGVNTLLADADQTVSMS